VACRQEKALERFIAIQVAGGRVWIGSQVDLRYLDALTKRPAMVASRGSGYDTIKDVEQVSDGVQVRQSEARSDSSEANMDVANDDAAVENSSPLIMYP
jgi:hypothetical protein